MDPKLIKEAKEIPSLLMDVVSSMFEESKPALRAGVATLRGSLAKLEAYLQEVEKEHLATAPAKGRPTGKAARKPSVARKKTKKRKTKAGGKQFPISEFVLQTLTSSRKPMKPGEIAAKLTEAGSGHSDPSAAVNNCLARLRKDGRVKRLKAGWKVA